MKRLFYLSTLVVCVLAGFALAGPLGQHLASLLPSSIGQGFISLPTSSSAATGFIQTLTAPVYSNFTPLNYNVGSGVVTSEVTNTSPVTSISLIQSDPNTTNNIAGFAKNIIASTFTVTEAFSATSYSAPSVAGMWVTDGNNPPNNVIFGIQGSFGLAGAWFTNYTTFNNFVITEVGAQTIWGPLVWVRIQQTVSSDIYSISADGINFTPLRVETLNTPFTIAQYGFAVESRGTTFALGNTQGVLYSFTETTP
jgi:hypothetical protein